MKIIYIDKLQKLKQKTKTITSFKSVGHPGKEIVEKLCNKNILDYECFQTKYS